MSKQFCLFPECGNEFGPASHSTKSTSGLKAQIPAVFWTKVGQFVIFPVAPDIFGRVEFRRIGWQTFRHDMVTERSNEVFDQMTAMNGGAIPDQEESSREAAYQALQKLNNLRAFDGSLEKTEVKVVKAQPGDDRNGRHVK